MRYPLFFLIHTAAHAMMADAPRLTNNSNVQSNRTAGATPSPTTGVTSPAVSPHSADTPVVEVEDDGGFTAHVVNSVRAERVRQAEEDDPSFTASGRARSAVTALNDQNDDVEISTTARNLRDIEEEVSKPEDDTL